MAMTIERSAFALPPSTPLGGACALVCAAVAAVLRLGAAARRLSLSGWGPDDLDRSPAQERAYGRRTGWGGSEAQGPPERDTRAQRGPWEVQVRRSGVTAWGVMSGRRYFDRREAVSDLGMIRATAVPGFAYRLVDTGTGEVVA